MARKIRPVLQEILAAIQGIESAVAEKPLPIFKANGCCATASSAELKSFPRRVGTSRHRSSQITPKYHGSK